MHTMIQQAFGLGTRVALPIDPGALRLFLALLVFVHHFSSFALGVSAVYVFFALSGYWLQRMWNERYVHTRAPYLTYIISRVWRLAPVMILVNLITLALLPLIGLPLEKVFSSSPWHLAFSSTFMLGYAWLTYLPVGSAWSLDIEMQFYVLAPLLSLILALRWKGILARLWLPGMVLLAGIVSVASIALVVPVLPKYLLFFVAGMAATRVDWSRKKRLAAISAFLSVGLVVAVFLSPLRGMLIVGGHPGPMAVWNPAFNVAFAFVAIPFALFTTSRPSDTTDKMFADLSYILYLLHWVAMQWFFQFTSPFLLRLEVAAASFVMVPLGSWLIWRFYDKPLNRLRAQWVGARMKDQPAPVEKVEAETAIN